MVNKMKRRKSILSVFGVQLALWSAIAVIGCQPAKNEARVDTKDEAVEQEIGQKTDINGKMVELTARCRVSLSPSDVHVMVAGKDLVVELPEPFRGKFSSGDSAWIGLTGMCHIEPQGSESTQTQADGYIEPKKILFFDQAAGHVESVKIVQ
jgi:hypothetical protein